MKQSRFIWLLIVGITVLAFVVRIWNLTGYPPALFADEASVGYNAYTIGTTLRDEHGTLLPLYFQAFGEYKNPLLIYGLVPIIKLFGLSEFTTRLGSVLIGTMTVLLLYFVTKKLFGTGAGLLAGFFLALAPWHIHYSRIAFELIVFPLVYLLAVYFLYRFLQSPTKRHAVFMSLAFALSVYSYGSARIIMPLLFMIVGIRYARTFFRPITKGIVIFSMFFLLITPSLFTTIAQQKVTEDKRMQLFQKEDMSAKITKIAVAYVNHLNPEYLFVKSELEYPGHFITRELPRGIGFGMKSLAVLFYIGIAGLVFSRNRYAFIVLSSVLLYPVPGSISNYMLTSTRGIIGIILVCMVSAYGLSVLCKISTRILKHVGALKYAASGFIGTVVIIGVLYEFWLYFFVAVPGYRIYASDFWGWQYGAKPILEYFKRHESEYDQMLMNGEFNGADVLPRFYMRDTCPKCVVGSILDFDPKKRQLFAASPDLIKNIWKAADRFKTKQTIYYPDGKPAFLIGEISPER